MLTCAAAVRCISTSAGACCLRALRRPPFPLEHRRAGAGLLAHQEARSAHCCGEPPHRLCTTGTRRRNTAAHAIPADLDSRGFIVPLGRAALQRLLGGGTAEGDEEGAGHAAGLNVQNTCGQVNAADNDLKTAAVDVRN